MVMQCWRRVSWIRWASGQQLAHVIRDHSLARRPPRSRYVPSASAKLAAAAG
jgi:hypothetical protein